MTDQLNSIGSPKPMHEARHEPAEKLKSTEQKQEKKLLSGEDRVSLDQTPEPEQTYGPIPGVEVERPTNCCAAW